MTDKINNMWKSWTIHFNVWVGSFLAAVPVLKDSFPDMAPYLPDSVFKGAMAVLVAGNILLRFKTNKSLADK